MYKSFLDQLTKSKEEDNLRILPGPLPDGMINLSSNDYLSLNENKALRLEFLNSALHNDLKLSSSSSRLLTGDFKEFALLESLISQAYNREACLIYNSGYHANTGILSCMAGKNDLIIADKAVHASIVDGIMLSKAKMERFIHLDYEHLEYILKKSRNKFDNTFIVSESIFSMDGDIADLNKLVALKKKYNCFLYLDEAHAAGVRGIKGLGCAEEIDCIKDCDIIIGTFGKAFASAGAYVVCDEIIKQFLVNNSRTLIFTTALPPFVIAWSQFIFEKILHMEEKRKYLQKLSKEFAELLSVKNDSQIIPFITGENDNTIEVSKQLREAGFYVLPIRYPTVPKGKARLRFSLNTNLNIKELLPIKDILNV